jgi:hypothetical protein
VTLWPGAAPASRGPVAPQRDSDAALR